MQSVPTSYPSEYKIFWEYTCDVWFPIYMGIIFLYIYILYVLMTTKSTKLKSPFFQAFIVIGFADVIDAIAVEYIRFSQRVGMGPSFGWILQITTAITGSNFCMHLVGNMLMALFQFTAVWFPWAHEKVWRPRFTITLLGLTVVIPIGVYSHLLFTEFIFTQDSIGRWVYVKRIDPITKTRILDSVLTVIQTIVCIILIIFVLVGIRIKTAASFKKLIPEKSLVLFEVIKIVFGSMQAMYGLIFLFNIPLHNPIIAFIFNEFVSYFFFLVTFNAITLPMVSRVFRKEMKYRFLFKNASTVAPSSSTRRKTAFSQAPIQVNA